MREREEKREESIGSKNGIKKYFDNLSLTRERDRKRGKEEGIGGKKSRKVL